MKTTLYYFSATGNCLSIAKKLQERIEAAEIRSIPQVMGETDEISGERIGIVAPIYMYNMPHLVAAFIRKIRKADEAFMVYAGAGGLGSGLKSTEKLFSEQGIPLTALFNVPMPSNYTPYGCPSEAEQQKLLADVDEKIGQMVSIILEGKQHRDDCGAGFFQIHVHPGLLYRIAYPMIRSMDRTFSVDDTCTACGICEKVCPVKNVRMNADRPEWQGRCEQCYACLQWCPMKAIQSGKKTQGIMRYTHPAIKVKEIVAGAGV